MASKNILVQHYDRILAVGILVVLLVSLGYLLVEGLSKRTKVAEYADSLNQSEPTEAQTKAVDVTAKQTLLEMIKDPKKAKLLLALEEKANLFTPQQRSLCMGCGAPIGDILAVCPFCKHKEDIKGKTREEAMVNPDGDGDGMLDAWEKKYGLNPTDAADADLDADKDGFSNLEEYDAQTDPKNIASHPSYQPRMKLEEVIVEKALIRAINKMEMGGGKQYVTFVRVNAAGVAEKTPRYAVQGEPILASGEAKEKAEYIFVSYEAKEGKTPFVEKKASGKTAQVGAETAASGAAAASGSSLMLNYNASVLTLKRIRDGREVKLTFFDKNNPTWPGEPLLELKAKLSFDLIDFKPIVVVTDETFTLPQNASEGDAFKVKNIDETRQSVRLEEVKTKKGFTLKLKKDSDDTSDEEENLASE